jgi:hypothetical protein
LPRVLWLNSVLPDDVPILVALNPFIQRYYTELERLGVLKPGRLLPWGGKSVWRSYNHVYFANELYLANENPSCPDRNPHAGGTTTYYPREMLLPAHRAFVPVDLPDAERTWILVVLRKRKARKLSNHEELLFALEQKFPNRQRAVPDSHPAVCECRGGDCPPRRGSC